MYYIYTLEDKGEVYVGCTQTPLARWYAHLRVDNSCVSRVLVNPTMYLRLHTTDKMEACRLEAKLIKELGTLSQRAPVPIKEITCNVVLFVPWRPKPPKRVYKVAMRGPTPLVYYKRKWHKFSSVRDAQTFADSL